MEVKKLASEKIIKQKEEDVEKLFQKMKNANLVLLTEYRGINVSDDTQLRKSVRNVNRRVRIISKII